MSDRSFDRGEKALQEFLSEAQEIIEELNRLLLKLDGGGRADPEVVNGAFRAVHSLKGLAGLFGVARLSRLSHQSEDLLDGIRLGRVELDREALDALFEAVEVFQRIVAEAAASGQAQGGAIEGGAAERLLERLTRLSARRAGRDGGATVLDGQGDPWGGYRFDAGLLAVLTEYEEHRLRENVTAGRALYRIHAPFAIESIDTGLEALKNRLKPLGEVITYLPSAESGDPTKIELDLVVGADADAAAMARALSGLGVELRPIPREGGAREQPAPPPPAMTPTRIDTAPGAPVELHAEGDATDERLQSIRSASQTVRVDIRKLDHLMNLVGELGLVRAGIAGIVETVKADRERAELARSLHRETRALSRKLDELQAAVLEVRMVPLGQVFDKLSRVVRKISRDANKEIRLLIAGAETELDKLIVEELSDPLMHMIRNCIDHGVEPREARLAAGKPEAGTIAIAAAQRGNHVVITVEDDGVGIDAAKLVQCAVRAGHLTGEEAAELSRRESLNLIFVPGLSTRESATEMSGRGVGMDVVKTNIARLSGIIDVESEPGAGTRLTLTLPITLAIIQALVIRAAGRTYAVPLNSVLETLLVRADDVRPIERREAIDLRGATLPVVRVEDVFRLDRAAPRPSKVFVVVVGMAQHRVGLVVDELVGQEDVVLKSLGRTLDGIPGIAGATELGGQQTVLVLDVGALVEEALGAGPAEALRAAGGVA